MGSAAMKELGIQMMIPAYSPQARRPNLIGSLKMCRAQERAIRNKLEILLNQILVMRAPGGFNVPQQLFGDALYEIYYRFLETEDEYFDYAPAAIPPQGRWKIYGIALPDEILRKVYRENALRIFRL